MSLCLVKRNVFSGNIGCVALRCLSSGSPAREYDVVVVGGGHNGLVSAAYLAKLGVNTAVFERRHLVGNFVTTLRMFLKQITRWRCCD